MGHQEERGWMEGVCYMISLLLIWGFCRARFPKKKQEDKAEHGGQDQRDVMSNKKGRVSQCLSLSFPSIFFFSFCFFEIFFCPNRHSMTVLVFGMVLIGWSVFSFFLLSVFFVLFFLLWLFFSVCSRTRLRHRPGSLRNARCWAEGGDRG